MPAAGSSARRYAQAVFDIATEQQQLDKWRDDLQTLVRALAEPTLVVFLRNPKLPVEVKQKVLREALPGISQQAINLATLLISRGRLETLMTGIADQYNRLLDATEGVVRVKVVTAVELDQAQRDQIAKRLAETTGKQVRMEQRVDPLLIGGMIIRLDNQVIDGSVRRQLSGLKRSLEEMRA